MATYNNTSLHCQLLTKKLSEKIKENPCTGNNQLFLAATVDDNILVWSQEDCCFYAQHLQQKDAILQTLCVTRPPLWTVQRISVNGSGTGVLLVGRRGVGVVDLPQRWGKNHTFDGGKEHTTCRIEYIAERFLVCHQQVSVSVAHWHPGSPNHNHVVLLATDNYLRVYSLRSRDVPEQALSIPVSRPDNVFSNSSRRGGEGGSCRLGGAVLGEEPVDFTIAAPFMPEGLPQTGKAAGDVGDSGLVSQDLLWPVFVLYANGDIYHTNLTLHPHRLRSRSLSGPLLLHPPRTDNYGLEWCSVTWLGESGGAGGVLVLATCGGRLHHCIVMPPQPTALEGLGEDNKEELLQGLSLLSVSAPQRPLVSLYVYECVEVELSLCPEEDDEECQLLLCADHTTTNRYLVLHHAGVHAVSVTVVDGLRRLALEEDPARVVENSTGILEGECEAVVDHMVCTRSLPSAAPQPVTGAALWTAGSRPSLTSRGTSLLVLLASGAVVCLSLPPLLPALPASRDVERDWNSTPCSDGPSFESLIASTLHRASSQPLLAGAGSGSLDPLEALDLTNRTLHTLRTQYIAPQAAAQQILLHRVRVMSDQQLSLCAQLNAVQQQLQQQQQRTEQLLQQQVEAKKKQEELSERLDAVVSLALRRMPGLSGGERWLLKQLHSIEEQVPHLQDDLLHLHTKLHWHSESGTAEGVGLEDSHLPQDSKLSQQQLHSLKKSIGAETEKIDKLVDRFNTLKKNMEI